MSRVWGQKKWITDFLLKINDEPYSEPMSMRQVFYSELPRIEAFVPERIKASTKWAMNFYNKMCTYCSDLFLEGRVSYRNMNIYDDSGASEYIYQKTGFVPPGFKYKYYPPEYPIEIWVENNATFNSLLSLVEGGPTAPYRINLVSGKGFVKSQQLEQLKLDRPDVEHILYLSDFDPSGVEMRTNDLPKRTHQLGLETQVHDIGVYGEQIPEERRGASLSSFSKKDPNAPKFIEKYGERFPIVKRYYGYEIQALTPPEIRDLVSEEIDKLL